jgi:protocatechuate 3,4-dioxygenase beta subunit
VRVRSGRVHPLTTWKEWKWKSKAIQYSNDPIARQTAQTWLFDAVAARPGTHTIRGRVTDLDGLGVHAARVTSGAHSTTTDLHGYYALRGLLPGARELACAHPTLTCPPSQIINLSDVDLEDVDLLALP